MRPEDVTWYEIKHDEFVNQPRQGWLELFMWKQSNYALWILATGKFISFSTVVPKEVKKAAAAVWYNRHGMKDYVPYGRAQEVNRVIRTMLADWYMEGIAQ